MIWILLTNYASEGYEWLKLTMMLTFGFLNENSEFLRLFIEEMLAEYKTF